MNWMAPCIVIGAGRSGTTLIASALGEHPDVYMIGETSFLLPRMWECFFSRPEYVNNYRLGKLYQGTRPEWKRMLWFEFWEGVLDRSLDDADEIFREIEGKERFRLARTLGEMFGKLLIPPECRVGRWGFKEIWNGGGTYHYSWDLYNDAYPEARFVHSLRNPFDFACSVCANEKHNPSEKELVELLKQWVGMVKMAREQECTGRYMEYRYEDLCDQPAETLEKVFDFLGLDLREQCLKAMELRYLASQFETNLPSLTREQIECVEGLLPLMQEIGYSAPPNLITRRRIGWR